MKTIEIEQQCAGCKGTGLYIGLAERGGVAVVCYTCNGTGQYLFKYYYEDFTGRKEPEKEIKRVIQYNPGIMVDAGNGHKLEDFGGIPYEDWKNGSDFPEKSEMRKFVCPAWWYQNVNYDKKPKWRECIGVGAFSQCSRFQIKAMCWLQWDNENKE